MADILSQEEIDAMLDVVDNDYLLLTTPKEDIENKIKNLEDVTNILREGEITGKLDNVKVMYDEDDIRHILNQLDTVVECLLYINKNYRYSKIPNKIYTKSKK